MMYQAIKKHAPVVEKYAQSLIKEGTVTQDEYKVGRIELLFLLMHTNYIVGWLRQAIVHYMQPHLVSPLTFDLVSPPTHAVGTVHI